METWAGCAVPDDRLYDLEADVWVQLAGLVALIGMTDVAQTRMGRLVQLSWKTPGRTVRRGRPLSVVESAKWVGPMIAPLSGTVVANNEDAFRRDVALANRDPYDRGWLYRLGLIDQREVELLATPEVAVGHYRDLIDREGLRCFRCTE
ncbi:MAG: glycine cleavage system protein H [Ferrimicrobium sp.]